MSNEVETENLEFEISNSLRERIALVVFALTLVLAGVVIFLYFSNVVNFNVAATKVDESIGTMDFCYSIVYKGTGEESAVKDPLYALKLITDEEQKKSNSDDETSVFGDASKSSSEDVESESAEENTSTQGKKANDVSSDSEAVKQKLIEYEAKLQPVYTSDVRCDYIDKKADLITVDMSQYENSEEPQIINLGTKKLGIFSITSYCTKINVEDYVFQLKEMGADLIMCIAPRSNMLGAYEGIDVILCTKEKSPSETSEGRIGKTFVFRSPNPKCVGVITVSDSNVFVQKVVYPKPLDNQDFD